MALASPARGPLLQRLQDWLAQSIAHRISFAAASLSGVFVFVIGMLSFAMTQALMRDSIRVEMNSEAVLVEERLSHELTVIAKSMESLARSSLVTNALVDSSGRTSYLEPHLREYHLVVDDPFSLALTDHGGRMIAANRPGLVLSKSADWIRQQIDKNAPYAELLAGAEPRLLLVYPVIFPASNTAEGMLLLELSWPSLMRNALRGMHEERIGLVSLGRTVVTASNASASTRSIMIARPLVVPAPLRQLELRLEVSRSWREAYGALLTLSLVYWGVALAALLLAVRLARMAAQRVVAPLRELTQAAERHRSDDSALANFPMAGRDEVGQLGAALQHMVEQLRAEHALLEQRVAERTAELNDLAYIVRRTSNGVVVTDRQGRVEWVNEGFVRITGFTLEEMRGKKPGDVLQGPDADPAVVRHMAMQFAAGEGFAVEIVNHHKSGRPYWVGIDAQPIRDDQGRIVKFVALESDITERKRVDQLKTDFVSVVSHELRTPLTAIRGALGLLAGGVAGELPQAARDMAQLALSNSERLTRLINDLLDIQKLESGKMAFQIGAFALPALIEETLAANLPYAQKYKVEIVVDGPVPEVRLRVDEGRFQQVMANLLSNAAKFSPEGGSVSIAAQVEPERQQVKISVRDRGQGIPDEFHARIFQKFSQADSSDTRAKDGTGLGLSITQALLAGMDGQIAFETTPGQGTTFTLSLPLADAGMGNN